MSDFLKLFHQKNWELKANVKQVMGHVPILLLKFLGDQLGRDTVHIVVDVSCTPFGYDRNPVPKWSKAHHWSSPRRATDVRMLFMTTWWREPPTTVEFFQSPWSRET